MAECVVISDEITGGSSVAAMLEKNRCTVCSLISNKGLKDPATAKFDCLVYSTNSRTLTPEQSYQLVFYAGKLLKNSEVKLYAKRIDPSMRGNTCTETQALLDALGEPDRVAIVVPAFPDLKRINVGGYILVDGLPLQKSLAGLDDMRPAQGGRVAELFSEKFRYHTEVLYLKEFIKGTEHLSNRLKELAEKGARAIVLDCTSQEDINTIADAVLASGIKFLAVDPGPFTATLARKVMREAESHKAANQKIFGLVGGISPLIAAQVEKLRLEEQVLLISVDSAALIEDDQRRAAEIDRVVNEYLAKCDEYKIIFVVSDHLGATSQQILTYETELEKTGRSSLEALDLTSSAYGQIARRVLVGDPNVKAIYSTGAEYTLAVCRELKSSGLNILGQVLPLTAYGEILGGDFNGLKYVTSSSSATDASTITASIQYLKRKMEI